MCRICGGPLIPLGVLGHLEHLKCRNCGMQFVVNKSVEPEVSDEYDAEGVPEDY